MSNEFDRKELEDREFDAYLQRDSEVSQRYRELASRDLPPALEAQVLRQAQQKAESRKAAQRRSWLRWGAPLAVAASALVTVSILFVPNSKEAAVPASAPSLTDRSILESSEAPGVSQAPEPNEELAVPSYAPPPAPPKSLVNDSAEDQKRERAYAPASARSAEPRRALGAGSVSVPAPASPQVRDESNEGELRGESAAEPKRARVMQSTRDSASNEVAANRAEADREAGASKPQSVSKSVSAAAADQAEPQRSADKTAGRVAPQSVQALAFRQAEDREVAPEVWLQRIRDARAQGKPEQAEEFLKRLRAAHPDFAVPPEISTP